MEQEEDVEPPPPSAVKVARRALVLSAVSCRGIIDSDNANAVGVSELAKHVQDWLFATGLKEELSAWERQILESPWGTLSDRDRINASWLSEAISVLAWSLGRADLPAFDEQCDPPAVANSLGFLQPIEETVLNEPVIQIPETLHEYNEFVYNVHWRLRDFSLNHSKYDFECLASKAWGAPVIRHGLKLLDKDLAVGGVSISRATEADRGTLLSITRERHRASNWLIGYGSEDFYEVTTDT